jgi:hypothetical protein
MIFNDSVSAITIKRNYTRGNSLEEKMYVIILISGKTYSERPVNIVILLKKTNFHYIILMLTMLFRKTLKSYFENKNNNFIFIFSNHFII